MGQAMPRTEKVKSKHDLLAPYWAAGLIALCLTGLSTVWFDFGAFWKGYVLDMTGPAWNYILFRGLNTAKSQNVWFRFFTPIRTLILFLFVCFGIECAQYFELYESTFDPWDYLAYVSLLILLFLMDVWLSEDKE